MSDSTRPILGFDGEIPTPPTDDVGVCRVDHESIPRIATPAADCAAFCLLDAAGRIDAATPEALAWLAPDAPSALPSLLRLAEAVQDTRIDLAFERLRTSQTSCEQIDDLAHARIASLQLVMLSSPSGPKYLAILNRRAPADTPSRITLDALTQLPDRRALAERVVVWRRTAAPHVPQMAVLFLDLDDFKTVNDLHGHVVGDAVLHTLAQRWLGCLREGDLVARYGGDEFVLLIRDATSAREIEPIVRRLRRAAQAPIHIGSLSLTVGASVGWATPTGDDWSLDALIASADQDMYARKRSVRGRRSCPPAAPR